MRTLLITVLLVLIPMRANAGFIEGNRLKKMFDSCNSMTDTGRYEDNWSKQFDCGDKNGYISGVIDALQGTTHMTRCVSDGVRLRQINAVVENWLNKHPERWQENGAGLVIAAINEAWPCPE